LQEVINLFIQLAESMGENVEFKLGTVCEGDELTASVNWHLGILFSMILNMLH
jgi:hypothetical protein